MLQDINKEFKTKLIKDIYINLNNNIQGGYLIYNIEEENIKIKYSLYLELID